MAKIAKFDKYSGKLKRTVSLDVYYHLEKSRTSNSEGFFYTEIPKQFDELYEMFEHAKRFHNRGINKIIIKGETVDVVISRYIDYLDMYHNAKTTTTKVILYRFMFSSKNKSSDEGKGKGYAFDGVANTYEAKIEFDFAVCDKTDFNGKISYEPHDKGTGHLRTGRDSFDKVGKQTGAGYGGWVEMPYTPETEEFFTKIYTGMEGIMDKLMKYIGTDHLAKSSIMTHQKLLA